MFFKSKNPTPLRNLSKLSGQFGSEKDKVIDWPFREVNYFAAVFGRFEILFLLPSIYHKALIKCENSGNTCTIDL